MNIKHLSSLHKSVLVAALMPDWELSEVGRMYQTVTEGKTGKKRQVDAGTKGVWVREKKGKLGLFVLTEANNLYETTAVGSPGLYSWAWHVLNWAHDVGLSQFSVDFSQPQAVTVPVLLDELLQAAVKAGMIVKEKGTAEKGGYETRVQLLRQNGEVIDEVTLPRPAGG